MSTKIPVTASMVAEVRDATNAKMYECKLTLIHFKGDIQAAINHILYHWYEPLPPLE